MQTVLLIIADIVLIPIFGLCCWKLATGIREVRKDHRLNISSDEETTYLSWDTERGKILTRFFGLSFIAFVTAVLFVGLNF